MAGASCENKTRKKQQLKAVQLQKSQWTEHTGSVTYALPSLRQTRTPYHNSMCPTGRALHHPAATILWLPDADWKKLDKGGDVGGS
jgi:hypothetical protein